VLIFSVMLIPFSLYSASAENIPEWIRNTALWYGEGAISETEFLNAIKFLIENDIIILDTVKETMSESLDATIIIPNGNFGVTGIGFYSPLNLETPVGTTVTWVNEDSVPHNIQSQDENGKVTDVFNSPPLNTGDRFKFTLEEEGIYNYFCSFHPWRAGLVTVK
jgi:plastocyanin